MSGPAEITRFVDNKRCVLVAVGRFLPLTESFAAHARRWETEPDPLGMVMAHQALAAASLYLSCRPRDENIAWTINFKEPPTNVFVAGDSEKETVVGRIFTSDVEIGTSSRLYVQAYRPHTDVQQSVIEFDGLDVLDVFERYYRQSDQHNARFFDFDDGRTAMIMGLPGLDEAWLEKLTREAADQYLESGLKVIDVRSFRFECGCSPERMMEVIQSIGREQLLSLFEDEEVLEITCPRCAHQWAVRREDLDEESSEG